MSTCHLLLEVDSAKAAARAKRADNLKTLLTKLEFPIKTYGPAGSDVVLTDSAKASNLETQVGSASGNRDVFSSKILGEIEKNVKAGDLIILTEGWQANGFHGLPDAYGGKIKGAPLVSMWIDGAGWGSKYSVFTSRFCMAHAAWVDPQWHPNWIYAPPYIPVGTEVDWFDTPIYDEKSDPFGLVHLEKMALGVPTVAPDWGVWAETVVPGVNGYLYRTKEGREKWSREAIKIKPERIKNFIKERYSLEQAVAHCGKFLRGLAKEG